jgi:hypothetical protein
MAYTGGALKVLQCHPDVFEDMAYLGTSSGSVIACFSCVGMPHETMVGIMQEFNEGFTKLGPKAWHMLIGMLGDLLHRVLPENAHELCDGRLVVGYTQVRCSKPSKSSTFMSATLLAAAAAAVALPKAIISAYDSLALSVATSLAVLSICVILCGTMRKGQCFKSSFSSKTDLINTILCSSSIPLVQDALPLRRGPTGRTWAIDGAFTMNHAILDDDTITVEWDVTRTPRPSVVPSVTLPQRNVTPPSTAQLYELLDMGANDFYEHVSVSLQLLPRKSSEEML